MSFKPPKHHIFYKVILFSGTVRNNYFFIGTKSNDKSLAFVPTKKYYEL
ncbi:hypothetical protein SPPR111872_18450 [Sphingobacterium prati]